MKLLIAGSRSITSYHLLETLIALVHDISHIEKIVAGGARGVDKLAERFALENNIPFVCFPADWDTYGKSAGFVRNEEQGDYADELLAIWDGKSRGTKHMIDYMKRLKKPVVVFKENQDKSTETTRFIRWESSN